MKYSCASLLCIAAFSLIAAEVQAADEDAFIGRIRQPTEQIMGQGHSALWTMPLVATQYQPTQPVPVMQAALQAQQEGRFVDALIVLDEAVKSGQASADTLAEMNLLRTSFQLQGNQLQQALDILASLQANGQHVADAYALSAMAYLLQGQMQQALVAAQHAHDAGGGLLPHLALSYALQGLGKLKAACEEMHGFNTRTTPTAISLAREAELELMLGHTQAAKSLVNQAQLMDAAQPYVLAVSGLAYLIDGQAQKAKTAFEAALKRDPKDAKALLGLGLAEMKLGNFDPGQKKLQAANEADPGNALILTYLGRSQQKLGQTEAARTSYRSAQQADPRDPTPWLYQAQSELQNNHPLEARESLHQAQERSANRSVYRGESLIKEDEQILQANLAEAQRQLGMEGLAFQTLSDAVGEKNSANLRNQADVLQGQQFGESARRSLLLQSQFGDKPGNLPSELDIYGDGAGQTGAKTPQHGTVSTLNAQQASYNNYDELFTQRTALSADATGGNQNTSGEQVRLGLGSDTLGISATQRQYKSDGNVPYTNLDNHLWQGIVQWKPLDSTQVFVSRQYFDSLHGETSMPGVNWAASQDTIQDNSQITRLGFRQRLTHNNELRALWSSQQVEQVYDYYYFTPPTITYLARDSAHSVELQYRHNGDSYATQWGALQTRGAYFVWSPSGGFTSNDDFRVGRQFYAAWQQMLNTHWQLDAGMGWSKIESRDNMGGVNNLSLARWLPQLGVVYTPDALTHLRLAAWQGMGVYAVGDATLAPVKLAGILLNRPVDSGKLVHAVAFGGDRQLNPAWLITAEIQRRQTDEPVVFMAPPQELIRTQVDDSKLALHWQPLGNPWTVSLAYVDEQLQNDPRSITNDSVQEQRLRSQQLAMRWFASAQWTVNCTWSHNLVTGMKQYDTDQINGFPISSAFQDSFNQLDANLNWKFSRTAEITAGVRNATNRLIQYTEIDKLNPRFSNGRLMYAKLKLAF